MPSFRPMVKRRNGFALPAVLAVTGVVTLIFLVALTALSSLTAEARSARERVSFLQKAMTAEARLAHMVMTEAQRPEGIIINGPVEVDELTLEGEARPDGELTHLIRLDGRGYLMDIDGPVIVRLQDHAGLVNLNVLSRFYLDRLLETLQLPPTQFGAIHARLLDYKDKDDLRQASGAESTEYRPERIANRPLLHPAEFLSILGVREEINHWAWSRVEGSLIADKSGYRFNLNTATPLALKIMLGLDDRQVERLLTARKEVRLLNTTHVDIAIGDRMIWDEEYSYNLPSAFMSLAFEDGQSSWTYRSRLNLTPHRIERPVWFDQPHLQEAPGRARTDTTNADRLAYAPY